MFNLSMFGKDAAFGEKTISATLKSKLLKLAPIFAARHLVPENARVLARILRTQLEQFKLAEANPHTTVMQFDNQQSPSSEETTKAGNFGKLFSNSRFR